MLAREVVELVAGAARVDEVGGDQRVVGRRATEPQELRVVGRDLGVAERRPSSSRPAVGDDDLPPGRDADPLAVATATPSGPVLARRSSSRPSRT